MRYRLDEKQLPEKLFPSLSETSESEIASLVTKIHEGFEQLDVQLVAVEEALAAVRAERVSAKIAICEAPGL